MEQEDHELRAVKCCTAFLDQYSNCQADKLELLHPHVTEMRKIVSVFPTAPLQTLVDMNVCPLILECIQDLLALPRVHCLRTQTEFLFEALWVVSNIASGDAHMVEHLMSHNILNIVLDVVEQWDDADGQDQAIWCLGNIVGNSAQMRDLVLERTTTLFPMLFQYEKQENFTAGMGNNLEWLFLNLCMGSPPPKFGLVQPIYLRAAERLQRFQELDPATLDQILLSLRRILYENRDGFDPKLFLPEECWNMLVEQGGILHMMMKIMRIPDLQQFRTCLAPVVALLVKDGKHERINDFEARMVGLSFYRAAQDGANIDAPVRLCREIDYVFSFCEQQDYRVAITLLSATTNTATARRIGKHSKLRMLPSDLIRMLVYYFVEAPPK